MKTSLLAVLLLIASWTRAQQFDFYGPQPFDEILDNSFNQTWSPTAISAIENRKYVVILDAASQTNALMSDETDKSVLNFTDVDNVHGATSTYGSLLRSIFQLVDINTHLDNDETALEGKYIINPMLHSYYAINAATDNSAACTDAGTRYIDEEDNTGYVLVEFDGTASSTTIKASSQWEYSATEGGIVEVSGWTTKWLKIDGTSLSWTTTEADASSFYLADATGLIDLTIEAGADFNPLSETYQTNATAELPEIDAIEDSKLFVELEMKVDADYVDQLGTTTDATDAASTMLDAIETSLTANGASLRYPKTFYLALRESMLSQIIASTDIYGARLDYNTIPHVYFTNASDDSGVPHPFMVIGSHAVSTRPNQLLDVSRPPGAEPGVGYGESTVTRHGKLGEFLIKIPLKDYGLIENLQDNDLTEYGDLATDFDNLHSTTTTKDVYNYTGLSSNGVAIDGVTIYPAYNNNLRFAVEDGEVTHSGIHVGGGLELHYHADGHGFNGNGINLYNLADYAGHDHPPVIGMAHDGIALFGKYESDYSSMVGYDIALDEYGGHDHDDGFGYHYHAHAENVESSGSPGTFFDEHFLLVGAWKGLINDIPGFDEGKFSQFADESIARYVGAPYESGEPTSGSADVEACESYEWEGTTYTESGTYTATLTSSTGGDSTATLNLTILESTSGSQDLEVCGSYDWEGTTYTDSGTYTATLTNSVGCDSTATLNLTITATSTPGSEDVEACGSYDWEGTTYTESGSYEMTLTSSGGCDSTATLNLTITDTSAPGSEDVETCGSYDWEGTTYTESGTYEMTLTSSGGCDSTATLNLTILEPPVPTVTLSDGVLFAEEQEGATYQWYDCEKDAPIGNQTNPQFTPMASGSFAVSISDGACTSMSECVAVEVVILDAKLTGELEVYPNPAITGFRILGINEPAQVTVMSVSGKVLSTLVYPNSETEIPIPKSSGVYLIKIEFGDRTLLKKVIKTH